MHFWGSSFKSPTAVNLNTSTAHEGKVVLVPNPSYILLVQNSNQIDKIGVGFIQPFFMKYKLDRGNFFLFDIQTFTKMYIQQRSKTSIDKTNT